ncbi:hypothetical protein OE88DRAFT_289043 [Heliocybe sulcata]|uniref:BZIP domain-containing protein n=1 Tax=Heliocybe sulcata TaxID=5364 RepID=A0A5C3N0A3_9AGAM|nr:hypothetical protein OE88DRAFT_289043 [Heliocybe sulcata]
MSSKRGRKRNDNLPPNRARDVQRAFRARRAAHLQAMEKRLEEVEEENNRLRAALNLPPANRGSSTGLASPNSGGTSSAESSRTSSMSPSAITSTITSPTTLQAIDTTSWDQAFMRDNRPDGHASPASATYRLSSVAQPMGQKTQSPYTLSPASLPSTSRQSVGNIYMPGEPQNYTHTADRPPPPNGAYDNSSNFLLRDVRDDPQHYPYSQPGFSANSSMGSLQHQTQMSDSPSIPSLSSYQHREPAPALSNLPYSHRRSITEPVGTFRGNVSPFPAQLTNLPPPPQGVRLSPPSRLLESSVHRAGHNPSVARVNQLP